MTVTPRELIENVPNPIGVAVVGSQSYGLATENSDTDRLGVYVEPTEKFLGLHPPVGKAATIVRHLPAGDIQWHEVGKFLALVLSGNPTVAELLWTPREFVESTTEWFDQLRANRASFLCAKRIRDAYFGYATQQLARLERHGRFAGSDEQRREKHARHILRLLDQGLHAYAYGEIKIRVDDPERYHAFGRSCVDSTEPAVAAMAAATDRFDAIVTPLPESPNENLANEILVEIRRAYLEGL